MVCKDRWRDGSRGWGGTGATYGEMDDEREKKETAACVQNRKQILTESVKGKKKEEMVVTQKRRNKGRSRKQCRGSGSRDTHNTHVPTFTFIFLRADPACKLLEFYFYLSFHSSLLFRSIPIPILNIFLRILTAFYIFVLPSLQQINQKSTATLHCPSTRTTGVKEKLHSSPHHPL